MNKNEREIWSTGKGKTFPSYKNDENTSVMHFCDTNDVLSSGRKEKSADGQEVMEMCESV